jgi:hypothetical protein
MDAHTLVDAPPERRIELRCDGGGYVGAFINNRWLELPCRATRCKRDGFQTVHRWDLATGLKSTYYRPTSPSVGDTPNGAH